MKENNKDFLSKNIFQFLNNLKIFEKPKIKLEQYSTTIEIIEKIIKEFNLKEEVKNKIILDLGAGTGLLGITTLILGAKKVTFIEKDLEAIEILKKNLDYIKKNLKKEFNFEIINKPLEYTDINGDFTIMNPPFGTKKKKIDAFFLDYALSHSKRIITIHKEETIDFLEKKIKELKGEIIKKERVKFLLHNTMESHSKEKYFVNSIILKIKSNLLI